MSLVVTVYVPEGVVMAGDSRLTLEFEVAQAAGPAKKHSMPSSDSTYKVFLAPGRIGISIIGAVSVGTTPIGPLLEAFTSSEAQAVAKPIDELAQAVLSHFRTYAGPPATRFHLAGYKGNEQLVFEVDVAGDTVKRLNTGGPGAVWGGEADVLARLFSRVGLLDQTGNLQNESPLFGTAFQHFTLQDAIDFAAYAIRTTADTMRFQLRSQTVGGPIDVLVIRPGDAMWIRRKELRITDTA